jgi:hypothetical protein
MSERSKERVREITGRAPEMIFLLLCFEYATKFYMMEKKYAMSHA